MASIVVSPSTVTTDATAGTKAWTTPENVTASDDADATALSMSFGVETVYILPYNFDLSSIPDGATIDGLEVSIEVSGVNCRIIDVYLHDGTTFAGTQLTLGDAISGTDVVYTYGSSVDLWGVVWTTAQWKDGTRGVGVRFDSTGLGGAARPDHIFWTVYYTVSGRSFTVIVT